MVGLSESLVYAWFDRSAIEYRDLYMRLYVSYNAWYRKITGKNNDPEAIAVLKTRFIIWDEYLQDQTMQDLRQVMTRIVSLTHTSPIQTETHTKKEMVADSSDWKGLIDFWYQVRCRLFHGVNDADHYSVEVQLAYESLYIFMKEMTFRMRASFAVADTTRLEELRVLTMHSGVKQDKYNKEKMVLQKKFMQSPELWNVDMIRVRKE